MKCDCGGDPIIVQIFWAGTEREARRCHLCCPDIAVTEIRIRDPETGEIEALNEKLQMRWGDQQDTLLRAIQKWRGAKVVAETKAEPRTWKDRLRDFVPEIRNFKELMFWR